MTDEYFAEFALDINKHYYKEKKQYLLTCLPKIGDYEWYSFHDNERKGNKIIYKEIFCISIGNVDTIIKLILLVKHVTGIHIECIYSNNNVIYASNCYSKQMNKDKVKELKQRQKTVYEKQILRSIFT